MKAILPALLTLTFVAALPSRADLWPQFRGPGGDGVAAAENTPTEFGEDENVTWKIPLPGRGWSSPVFDGEHLWLTTAVESFPTEEEKTRRLEAAGEKPRTFEVRQVADRVELAVLKIDYASGQLVDRIDLETVDDPQTIHTLNSFASPTPALDSGRLVAHFGDFGTFCIDTDRGEVAWERRIELEHGVGPGSSPVVHDGLLYLICDGIDRQFVTALHMATGETAWTTDRPPMRAKKGDQKKSYNTPVLLEGPRGRQQLVCMGAQWLVSYDPKTGREWWRFDHGNGFSVVPRPVYGPQHGLLFACTGFGNPDLVAIRPDGEGDITGSERIAWRESKRIPAKPSPLLVGDELYVISDSGVTTCFDAVTGRVHWNERIEGNYSASPLFADGKIHVASQEGVVTVFAPGRSYRQLAENRIEGSIMASPLALDGALVVRSDSALYRFGR